MELSNTQMSEMSRILNDIENQQSLSASITEAIKELAEDVGCKPGEIRRVLQLVSKERKKSGTLTKEGGYIDTAQELV